MNFNRNVIILQVCLIIIIVNLSYGNESNKNALHEITYRSTNLLLELNDRCLADKSEPVILIGNWSNSNLNDYHFQNQPKIVSSIGIYNMDNWSNTANSNYSCKNAPLQPYPIKQIILVELDVHSLKIALRKLKESIWWNIKGSYFIENVMISLDTCGLAPSFLNVMWKFNILTAVFVCRKSNTIINLYTFNPYTQYAPKMWTKFLTYKTRSGYSLTLFKQSYNLKDSSNNWDRICSSLNFDKTITLSGYPIKMAGASFPFHTPYVDTEKSSFKFRGMTGNVWETILMKLNANVSQELVTDDVIVFDESGIPNENNSFWNKYDAAVNIFYEGKCWRNVLNTFAYTGICYVINKHYMSVVQQFSNVFPLGIWLSTIPFLLFAVIVFKYLLRQNISRAAMDVLRAILGVATLQQPKYYGRLLFMYYIFLFMIFTTFLQSNLSSMLTTPTRYKRVENVLDLVKYNYKIYTTDYYRQYFNSYVNKHINNVYRFKNCFEIMQIDANAACINDCEEIKLFTGESKTIHIVPDSNVKLYYVFLFRDDFPLMDRIRTIYYRMLNHGITVHFYNVLNQYVPNTDQQRDEFKVISVYQIRFALYLLFIGCLSSSFIFFTELLIRRNQYLKHFLTLIGHNS